MFGQESSFTKGTMGRGRRLMLCIAGSVAAASLALGVSGAPALAASASSANDGSTAATATATASTSTDAEDASPTLAETVAQKALPSVGTVTALVNSGTSQGISMGSCVVYDADGDIITNYHVIEGATKISVKINDKTYDAEIVGSDPSSDIAVLKIDPGDDELTPIEVGSSSDLKVGEWVMTIGAPLEQDHSVSVGIVSGLNRTAAVEMDTTTAYYPGLIQTDAMINSGSSGGALVNDKGELVGITTINYSESGSFAGMSAAIPSDYATKIADEIISTGSYAHPYLGISLSDVTPYNYEQIGASDYFGAYVADVVADGPAAEAGIQAGDVITAVDGTDVYDAQSVIIAIRAHSVGDQVTITVERDGETKDVSVTLGSDADAQATTGTTVSAGSQSGTGSSDGSSNGGLFSIFGGNGNGSGSSNGSSGDSGWGWGYNDGGNYGYWNGGSQGYGNGGYGYGNGGYGYDGGSQGYGYGSQGNGNGGYGYGYGYNG